MMDKYRTRINKLKQPTSRNKELEFSIITATYDKRKNSLLRAIRSIPDYPSYEHIIAFQEYKYCSIPSHAIEIIIKECTEWGNKQKNEAIKVAKGKWIIFLDDDNILSNNSLESISNTIRNNPDSNTIYSFIYYGGKEMGPNLKDPLGFQCGQIDLLNWCIKKEVLDKVDFPLYGYNSDFILFNNLRKNKHIKIAINKNIIGHHLSPC